MTLELVLRVMEDQVCCVNGSVPGVWEFTHTVSCHLRLQGWLGHLGAPVIQPVEGRGPGREALIRGQRRELGLPGVGAAAPPAEISGTRELPAWPCVWRSHVDSCPGRKEWGQAARGEGRA